MPDSLRAESLACYGHPLVRTPNYDRVAREGVRFDQCHGQYPVCGPSRCSMMTGLYPHNTGCRTNEYFLRPPQESLFTYLKAAGYHVEWHGKNDLYAPDAFPLAVTRCNQRPDSVRARKKFDVHQGTPIAPPGEPGSRSFLCEPLGTPEDYEDAHRIESALHWLDGRQADDPPFALYLALEMPHPPYTVPASYYQMFSPDDVPPLRPFDLPGKPARLRLLREYHGMDRVSDAMLRQINAVYLGMVAYSDWLLGRVLEALDRLHLSENTVLVVLSDHGDYAGDYGLIHKHLGSLEDVHTRVPFIWRGPGMVPGHVEGGPVELFDMMATCLDLAGIPCAHPHFARSLRRQLGGGPGDPDRAVFAEGGLGRNMEYLRDDHYMGGRLLRETANFYHPLALCGHEHPEITARGTMLRTLDHKLIYRPDDESELYDLRNDPRELCNLYLDPAYASIRQGLEHRLLDWLVETSDVTPPRTDPRNAPAGLW